MVTVQLSQEVKDFIAWKAIYDSLHYFREEHGISEIAVFVTAENPDKIVLFLDAPCEESVHKFFNSKEIKEGMKKGGVIGKTTLKILKRIR